MTVPLVQPGSKFLDRQNQLDIGVEWLFKLRHVTLQHGLTRIIRLIRVVLNAVQPYSSALNRLVSILPGRPIRFGMRANS